MRKNAGASLRAKRPANEAEGICFDELTRQGWKAYKRGWPDFNCFHPTLGLVFVEVKRNRHHKLKPTQDRIMRALVERGIACYRYSPEEGFVPFKDSPAWKVT